MSLASNHLALSVPDEVIPETRHAH